jgi:hypothetical protein
MALGFSKVISRAWRKVVARLDVQQRRIAGFGQQHLDAQPGQVNGARPLHDVKSGGVGGHDGRHAGHCGPQQNLVAGDHAEGRAQAARDAALAGRGDQRQVARAGNQQKHDDCDDKSAVVGHTGGRDE